MIEVVKEHNIQTFSTLKTQHTIQNSRRITIILCRIHHVSFWDSLQHKQLNNTIRVQFIGQCRLGRIVTAK